MPDQRLECPRCRGAMGEGYLRDLGHYSSPTVAHWVEGTPEKSFWSGLKTKDRAVLPLTVYRCERCGYLEWYANAAEPSA